MTYLTDRIFKFVEPFVPEGKKEWLFDMHSESRHIRNPVKHVRFVFGCVRATLGLILHDRFGVKRVGQILLGAAVLSFSLLGVIFTSSRFSPEIATPVYFLLLVYGIAGGLGLLSLDWMRRFLGLSIVSLSLVWLFMTFISTTAHKAFIAALSIEAILIMTILYAAAGFLAWSDGAEHV